MHQPTRKDVQLCVLSLEINVRPKQSINKIMKKTSIKLGLSKQSIQNLNSVDLSRLVGGAFPPINIPQTLSACMSRGGEDGQVTCRTQVQ